jgi:hypothetical protein
MNVTIDRIKVSVIKEVLFIEDGYDIAIFDHRKSILTLTIDEMLVFRHAFNRLVVDCHEARGGCLFISTVCLLTDERGNRQNHLCALVCGLAKSNLIKAWSSYAHLGMTPTFMSDDVSGKHGTATVGPQGHISTIVAACGAGLLSPLTRRERPSNLAALVSKV